MRVTVSARLRAMSCLLLLAGCLDRELTPLNPCLATSVNERQDAQGIGKVDLLFVVDNSSSMVEEQAKLRAQFPKLIRTLTSGTREDGSRFTPVSDLHLAVITTDMGTPGVTTVRGCSEFGGDGVFRTAGNAAADPLLADCAATFPPFLEFRADSGNSDTITHDFSCVAAVGSGGCGYEQQLEAPLKALWPQVNTDALGQIVAPELYFLAGTTTGGAHTTGHGDRENAGFLRNDPSDPSLLAIVLVTDEDDCSVSDTAHFGNGAEFAQQAANLRCHENPGKAWPIARYAQAFKQLRPEHPELVLFAAIAGVPTNLIDAAANVDFDSAAARDAYYDMLLGASEMQEVPYDRDPDPQNQVDHLVPACRSENGGEADPARRIVELAKAMGEQSTVQSICAESFEPAIDAIITLISSRLRGVCLPRALVRKSDGKVACEVVWELPGPSAGASFAGAPRACSERPYLSTPDASDAQTGSEGGKLCVVTQLAVQNDAVVTTPLAPQGWYYDDFSPEVLSSCGSFDTPQRVGFTDGATPPAGVTVNLVCFDEAQRYVSNRDDVSPARPHPEIGDSCEQIAPGATTRDEMCWVTLADPAGGAQADGIDRSMLCHPTRNVCVRACSSRAECPPAWVCDDSENTVTSIGSAICVNPTCAAGDDP